MAVVVIIVRQATTARRPSSERASYTFNGSSTIHHHNNMPAYRVPSKTELVELLGRTGAAKISLKKEFKLASGAMSDHYFDLRLLCGDPRGIGAVSAAIYDIIKKNLPGTCSVGGIESGSISIATAISHPERAGIK